MPILSRDDRTEPALAGRARAGEEQKPLAQSRKSAGKREAILRAAIEIINAKSFALATMTEIAASLDLRDATLYYYFSNKQALVYACHVRSLERFEALLLAADQSAGTGLHKLRGFISHMLDDSEKNGPQLYFGDHSYLEDAERYAVDCWADRLKAILERFVEEGLVDGSIVHCEPQLIVQLLLGMLIWLGKWVPSVKGLTVDRLMAAIGTVGLDGLASRAPVHD
jgi:AcrR family transcriptional regulator